MARRAPARHGANAGLPSRIAARRPTEADSILATNGLLCATRRYCEVCGLDYVPALLERAALRAAAEGVQLELHAGDAQAMPFESACFDVVLSSFGIMFAPDQQAAAAEMLRVCREGGRLGLASWTPEGEVGRFFEIVGRHAPPPPGLAAPTRWGSEAGVRQLLGSGVQALKLERRTRAARDAVRPWRYHGCRTGESP